MKNLKILLPMLAFIFAIGVAFTAPDHKEEPEVQALDYILVDGNWQSIDDPQCQGEGFDCTVKIGEDGPTFRVYDEMNTATLKSNNTGVPVIIN